MKSNNKKGKYEKNNFQDAAERREYNKGKAAGKQSKNTRGNRNKFSNNANRNGKHLGETDRMDAGYPASVNGVGGGPVVANNNMNSPEWHAPSPQLLSDSSSINFNYPVGTTVNLRYQPNGLNNADVIDGRDFSVPGIMAFEYMPTIGRSKMASDPFNQAMFQEYNWLRQANSGTSYYQAADLGVMQICQISAYSLLCELTRVYGLLSNFSPLDRYTPQALVEALGFNYSSLSANKTRFRDIINLYSDSLQKVCLPIDIKYMDRQMTLLNHVYVDAESTKAQYYVFSCLRYWKFVEATESSGTTIPSSAVLTQLTGSSSGGLITIGDVENFIPNLLNPLINSTVGQKISADVLKAFGAGNVYKVQQIAETYKVTPIYSKEILSMIENLTINGGYGLCVGTITQNLTDLAAGSFLEAKYQVTASSDVVIDGSGTSLPNNVLPEYQYNRLNWILNFHWENPQPGDVMEATRMTNLTYGTFTADAQKGITYITVEDPTSEIVVTCNMYFINPNNNAISVIGTETEYINYTVSTKSAMTDATIEVANLRNTMRMISSLSAFDWHPQIYTNLIGLNTSKNGVTFLTNYSPILDFDNYTLIDVDDMRVMNETSLRGLFKVRSMPNV